MGKTRNLLRPGYFLSPPPFGEGLYSFTRVRMYNSVVEDTDRILTFNTWNRREIFPSWRLRDGKSCQSSSFWVFQGNVSSQIAPQAALLLTCWSTKIHPGHGPALFLYLFLCFSTSLSILTTKFQWSWLFNRILKLRLFHLTSLLKLVAMVLGNCTHMWTHSSKCTQAS